MSSAPEDWQVWLHRHGPGLLLFARQFLRDPALAEDAVQDGFIRFWRSKPNADDPLGLLYAAVRSASLDLLRSGRRRVAREQNSARAEARSEIWFDHSAEQAVRVERVQAVLAELPTDQREVVVLKLWSGLTFSQIAEAVGESQNTVASRYRYALEKIAAQLAAEGQDER